MNNRLKQEQNFHDALVKQQGGQRHFIRKVTQAFYDKQFLWRNVFNKIGDLSGKKVCDYGCGTGNFSFELAKRGAKVYGIDISQKSIVLANQRKVLVGWDSMEFSVQDAHKTNFESNFFDFVFGSGILHHLELEGAFHEIKRILKPGGVGYFLEPLDKHPAIVIIRRLTPKARTKAERPLNFNDIYLAQKFFKRVTHKEYFLISVAATPFHLISVKIARFMVRFFHQLDQAIFQILPCSKRFAWITLIRIEKENI